jgi:hypothetical protein
MAGVGQCLIPDIFSNDAYIVLVLNDLLYPFVSTVLANDALDNVPPYPNRYLVIYPG